MKTVVLYVVMSMTSVDGDITGNVEEHDFQPLSWTANTTQEYDKAWEECKLLESAYRQLEAVEETDCFTIEGGRLMKIYIDGKDGYETNHIPRIGETLNLEGNMRLVVDVTHNIKKQWDGSFLDYIFIQAEGK